MKGIAASPVPQTPLQEISSDSLDIQELDLAPRDPDASDHDVRLQKFRISMGM